MPCDASIAQTNQARDASKSREVAKQDVSQGKILAIPDVRGVDDLRRCDISKMAIAVRDNGQLRQIYRPDGPWKVPDNRLFVDPLDPDPDKDLTLQKAKFIDPVIAHLQEQVERKVAEHAAQSPGMDKATFLASLEQTPIKILIYAHGGLVSHQKAVLGAEALAPVMIRDDYIPLFLIWNSDLPISYVDRLCCVRRGSSDPESHINQWAFIPTRLASDVGGGIAALPENLFQALLRFRESELTDDYDLYYLNYDEVGSDCYYFTDPPDTQHPCANIVFPDFGALRGKKDVGYYKRLLNGGVHNLRTETNLAYLSVLPVRIATTGALARVGSQAWDNMLRRTRLAFDNESMPISAGSKIRSCHNWKDEDGKPTPDEVRRRDETLTCPTGGFTRFFNQLKDYLSDVGDNGDRAYVPVKTARYGEILVPVTLEYYGHSAGAVVGDELITRYPGFPWSKIVYMAAADTVRDFKRTTLVAMTAFPDKERRLQFYNLTLHPLAETREREGYGAVPEGSLLEWIDEIFSGPKTGDDRTVGKWKNVEATLPTWRQDILKQVTFRVFPSQTNLVEGRRSPEEKAYFSRECDPSAAAGDKPPVICHPLKHGDFNSFSFWRQMYLTGSDGAAAKAPAASP